MLRQALSLSTMHSASSSSAAVQTHIGHVQRDKGVHDMIWHAWDGHVSSLAEPSTESNTL